MKIRLIALILCALVLCAPTMRPAVAEAVEPCETELPASDPVLIVSHFEEVRKPTEESVDMPEIVLCSIFEEDLEMRNDELEETEPEAPEVWREDVPLSAELQAALLAICAETGVDPLLALGLIQTESNFQTDIVSPTGDYGLCQLCRLYFPTDLTPEENMRTGIGYLAELLSRYSTTEAALTAYNRGHDDGSRSYARVVLGHAAAWGYGA